MEIISINAQDTVVQKKTNVLNTQTLLSVKTENQPADSTQFKTPKYKQGFSVILKISSTVKSTD